MCLGATNPDDCAPNPIPVLGSQERHRNLSQQTASSHSLLDPSVVEHALADGAISSLPLNPKIDVPMGEAETRKSLRVSPLLMNGQIGTATQGDSDGLRELVRKPVPGNIGGLASPPDVTQQSRTLECASDMHAV
jgi:hypothetical protein